MDIVSYSALIPLGHLWLWLCHSVALTDGTRNQVADSLSCYYEYDTIEDEYPNSEFVKADKILDPDGDLAPIC